MLDTPQTPPGDEKRFDQEIENCERSLAYSYWALGLGLGALNLPAAEFSASIRDDPHYARMMVEIYKMMLLDQGCAALRAHVAATARDRIRLALDECGLLPGGDLSKMSIDYSLVPLSCGIEADDINSLRPDNQLLLLYTG